MLKKILIIIGVIIFLGAISIAYFIPSENTVLNFIKDNPKKTAIKLVRNDSLIAEMNPNKMMPLASTVKIILAIEYAIQASKGNLNPDEEIPLEELALFFVKDTDGGAHQNWIESVKQLVNNDKIPIREVVKGMIRYSSNANTEWLSQKLGLENINSRIDSLGVSNHTNIYYLVSALFVGKEKFPNLSGKELEKKLKDLPLKEYINSTNLIHTKLLTDPAYKLDLGVSDLKIQRIWSDNLPSSTVSEYIELMRKLNSKTYFNAITHQYLDEVMEGIMDNPANQKWLEHSGMKGGSTAFVLTKAIYATDKKYNTTELAYFFNDLGILDNIRLQLSMNEFELKVLTNKGFRDKIEKELKN